MHEGKLDASLAALATSTTPLAHEGLIDGVWERVGQMQERAEARIRLALFCGVFVIGLGAGMGAIQSPAAAQPSASGLVGGDDLSLAALLHIEP